MHIGASRRMLQLLKEQDDDEYHQEVFISLTSQVNPVFDIKFLF